MREFNQIMVPVFFPVCVLEHGINGYDEKLSDRISYNCSMIMQCSYVRNIQDFEIIRITQCHRYKLNGHTLYESLEVPFRTSFRTSLPLKWYLEVISYITSEIVLWR